MTHTIPRLDWHLALVQAIEQAVADDTIVCHTEMMQVLAERVRQCMCPEKPLVFTREA